MGPILCLHLGCQGGVNKFKHLENRTRETVQEVSPFLGNELPESRAEKYSDEPMQSSVVYEVLQTPAPARFTS